jgi:hypothetical protein
MRHSCGYYMPPLGSVSSLFLTFTTILLKKSLYPNDYKSKREDFSLFESKIGECLDAASFLLLVPLT